MKWVVISVTDEAGNDLVTARHELPDMRQIMGPLSVYSVLETRLHALSTRICELMRSRGYGDRVEWHDDDGEVA
jgi:hypothetical protein